ncbi:MAG: cytochrome c oxidase accessory protein CcoG [Verrucomicrobia bacterium]|nr:cytochrome c oxidase accessory protein CcoG [Verrucomicrobiota bacterium]
MTDQTFRDTIPTVDASGRRVWMYPRKPPTGKRAAKNAPNFFALRTYVSWVLLVILFAGPFIKINGRPLLMMNILERKFSIFGVMFWPQDFPIFALAMIAGFVALVLFTAVFGRIWCGWMCPQTVLMEMVFRKIEYAIEGDAAQQKALNAKPWDQEKMIKKGLKHGIFFLMSFVISNLLLGYIIGGDALIELVTSPPTQHAGGFFALLLFTLLFYAIFARFREQACTFVCPYGRFQSVLLDENSLVVAYDHKRGEKRARKLRGETWEERLGLGKGDCVDCGLCVVVCPTGIDIRNGTQMECVNCCNCIDACNSVMEKVKRPAGLIRHASQDNIEKGERFKITPRIKAYCALLGALLIVLVALMATRQHVNMDLLRMRGSMYQVQPDGRIGNTFEASFLNKTGAELEGTLTLLSPKGELVYRDQRLILPAEETTQVLLVVLLDPEDITGRETSMDIGLEVKGRIMDHVKTTFMAPESAARRR